MRTKHLLTMAAMTLGFAACTQEELIENVASNPMDRPALDMTIEFPGTSVDSRLVYDEASFGWKWEAGDKFSAFMTDGATAWTVADNLATNYIYSQGEDGSYSTTSQMVEGMYWYFAPAKEDKVERSLISYELSTNQPADYYKSEASQMYFSPIYKLEAKNNDENVVLKPTVYNLYSQAIFHLKNNGGSSQKDMYVYQIILKGETGFDVKGEISPVKVAKTSVFAYDVDEAAFVQTVDSDEDGVVNTEDDLKSASVSINETTEESIALNVNQLWKKGETLTATMLVPQATAQDLTVIIITDCGVIEIDKNNAPELEDVSFKHHGAKYVFGKLSNNAMKPFSTNSGRVNAYNGVYVTSAESMVELINNSQTALTVNKVGSWSINEDIINAANNNANVRITFVDLMNVENNLSKELVMNNFTFNEGWVLTKGAIQSSIAPEDVIGGKLNYQGTGELVNNGGEITINKTGVTSVINNSGKIIFNANSDLTTLTNGVKEESVGELVVNANRTVKVTGEFENVHFTDADGVHHDSNIEINGTLNAEGMTNNGTVTVNGKLLGGTNGEGEIYNAGEIDEVTNDGYIEIKDYESTTTNIYGGGIINNDVDGYVSVIGDNTVYFNASGSATVPSGATLAVVNNKTLYSLNGNVDVIFMGVSTVRGNVSVTNLYVGYPEEDGKYSKVIERIVGEWNVDDNTYEDFIAGTKLSLLSGTTSVRSKIYNYATVLNRTVVNGVVMETNVWNGEVPNASSLTGNNISTTLSNAVEGQYILLPAEGVVLTRELNIEKDVIIKGGAISGSSVTVASSAKVTFDGVAFKSVDNDNDDASSLYYKNGTEGITIRNCTFEGFQWDAIQIVDAKGGAEIVITGCTFKTPTAANALNDGSYIHIANETSVQQFGVEISENKFETADSMIDNPIKIYGVKRFQDVKVGKNTVADTYNSGRPYIFVCKDSNYRSAAATKILSTEKAYNKFVGDAVKALTNEDL